MRARALMVLIGGSMAIAVAVLSIVLSAGGASYADGKASSDAPDQSKVVKSSRLADASTVVPKADSGPVHGDHASLRGATARLAAKIPLPEGANFNGLHFDSTVAQGGMRDDSLMRLLQANAACQWYSALAAGREVATAQQIIPQIVRWSGVRNDGVFDAATQDFVANEGGDAFGLLTATCEETRAEQRAYAMQHGLEPTI